MPRNGTGTYSLPQPPFIAGTVISSAAVNSDFSDIATALTGSLPRDGQAGMIGQFKAIDGSSAFPSISFNNDDTTGFYRPGTDELGVVVGGQQVALFTSGGLPGLLPIGCIVDYGGVTIPSLWYLCYGQAVSRSTYSLLFTAIGTTYGSGDGSTTFNLPDLRGTILAGADNMGGSAAGRLTTTFFGSDPTVIGDRGGIQDIALATGNLPSYTISGNTGTESASHSHAETTFMQSSGVTAASSGGPAFLGTNVAGQSTGVESTSHIHGYSFTTPGSSSPFSTVQPSIIVNKMIYAGA